MDSRKKKIIALSVSAISVGLALFMATKRRSIRFYDNVWCDDDTCSGVDPSTYVSDMISSGSGEEFIQFQGSEGVGKGYLNLLFPQGHKLKEGDVITIKQDSGATYPYYNGETVVKKVLSPYIIRTAKAYMGSSESMQGAVHTQSWLERLL